MVHKAAHFEVRALSCVRAMRVDRTKIDSAAKHIIASCDDYRACLTLTCEDAIERVMYGPHNIDVNSVTRGCVMHVQGRDTSLDCTGEGVHKSFIDCGPGQPASGLIQAATPTGCAEDFAKR